MAGDVKESVQSGALSTSGTGTTDFTKSGFGTPKAWIVLVGFDEADNTSVQVQSRMSIGFGDGTNNFCISHQDEDNSAKVDCDAIKSNTKSFIIMNVGNTVIIDGTSAAITDGVRLTNTTNTDGDAPFVTVIMFGGADLNISLQRTTINSSQDGTATIAHSGFTDGNDKLIFFIGTDISGEDSPSTGINNSFGVCHATGSDAGGWTLTQRCLGWASDHNNTVGSPSTILSTDRVLDIITEAGTQDWGLEVTAFSNSGGTWTVTTRDNGSGAGMEVYSLALDLDDRGAKVGSVDAPTSTGAWTPSVSLGFTPQSVGLGLTFHTSENAISSVASASSVLGISSNTGSGEETCHSWYNQDAEPTTNTNNQFRSKAIDLYNAAGSSNLEDFDHSSFNSGDWTYTANATTVVAHKWFYWAIEEAAAGVNTETIAATAIGVVTLDRTIFKDAFAATATGVATLGRLIFKTLVASAIGVATLATQKLILVAIAATATGIAALSRVIFKTLVVSASGVAALGRVIFKALMAAASGLATISRIIFKTLRAIAAGVAAVIIQRIILVTVAATATGVASLARLVFKTLSVSVNGIAALTETFIAGGGALTNVAINAVATGVVSLSRTIFKTLTATASGTAAVGRIIFKIILAAIATGIAVLTETLVSGAVLFTETIAATATGIATLVKMPLIALTVTATGVLALGRLISKSLSAVAVGIATLNLIKLVLIVFTATASGIASLNRTIFKTLTVTASATAILGRLIGRTLIATASGGVSLARTVLKTLAATASGVVALRAQRLFEVGIAAVAAAVATLNALYVQFFAPFTGGSGLGVLDRTQTRWKRRRATWRKRR